MRFLHFGRPLQLDKQEGGISVRGAAVHTAADAGAERQTGTCCLNSVTTKSLVFHPALGQSLPWFLSAAACAASGCRRKDEDRERTLERRRGDFKSSLGWFCIGISGALPPAPRCQHRWQTLDLGEDDGRVPQPSLCFPSFHFSLKPADIPSLLCCCNANLLAPFKRGRWEEEGGQRGSQQFESTPSSTRSQTETRKYVHNLQSRPVYNQDATVATATC